MNFRVLFTSVILLGFGTLFSQEPSEADSGEEMSLFDHLKSKKKRGDKNTKKAAPQKKSLYISGIPVISSNPVVGTAFGGVLSGAFVLGGDFSTTKFSAVTSSVVYTTNQQTTFAIKNFIYLPNNEWVIQGTFNWRVFPMFTWGVGGNTPDRWASKLENNGFLFDQSIERKIGSNWYIGTGININYIYEQGDENVDNTVNFISANRDRNPQALWSDIDQTLPFVIKDETYPSAFADDWDSESAEYLQRTYFRTPFQLYPYGTGDDLFVAGLKLTVTHDSRDNINTPRSGTFFNFQNNLFFKFLGNDQNFSVTKLDFRKYWSINSYKDVVAFRTYGVVLAGDGPYVNMPANNTDPNSTGTRGVPGFRYRGKQYIASEVEYRKHLWRFLSGVAFVNAHSVTELEQYLEAMGEPLSYDGKFRYINPGYGLGLRVLLNKQSRMSISFDYAWNKNSFVNTDRNNSRGEFYMGMNAAF